MAVDDREFNMKLDTTANQPPSPVSTNFIPYFWKVKLILQTLIYFGDIISLKIAVSDSYHHSLGRISVYRIVFLDIN